MPPTPDGRIEADGAGNPVPIYTYPGSTDAPDYGPGVIAPSDSPVATGVDAAGNTITYAPVSSPATWPWWVWAGLAVGVYLLLSGRAGRRRSRW